MWPRRRRPAPSTSSADGSRVSVSQVGHRTDSNAAKPLHTGQANARTSHMVSRCNCFSSGTRCRFAANPARARIRICPTKASQQAKRLPEALKRFPITRLVSSPQRRSIQTAQPVADALGLTIDIDDRIAEYDRDLAHYIPIEQIAAEYPEELARLASGHLPSTVDETRFWPASTTAIRDIVAAAQPRGHRRGVQPRRGDQRTAAQHPAHREDPVRQRRLRGHHPAAVLPRRQPVRGVRQRHRTCMGSAAAEISGGRQVR